MIVATVGCIIILIGAGIATIIISVEDKEFIIFSFGLILTIFGVIGFLSLEELIGNDNSQYIPAEPLAHNQNQTVFTTDRGTYTVDGLYPDGIYLLTVDGKDVLVVWQAVDGKVG